MFTSINPQAINSLLVEAFSRLMDDKAVKQIKINNLIRD
jgi:hypothetical protein